MRSGPALTLALGALAALSGCLATSGDTGAQACASAEDCNGAAGEECADGVCWGDPPTGAFAAVLSPGTGDPGARTEVEPLFFTPNGWMTAKTEGPPQIVVAATVRVRGQVTAPCPAALTDCSGNLLVPARLRFSRISPVSGERVAFETTSVDGEYQLSLPRPTEPVLYTVSIAPVDVPIGPGLPSPAELIAPRRLDVSLEPSAGDEIRLALPLAETSNQRLVSGSVSRMPPGTLAGWRVHAEAASTDDSGGFERVSNFGRVEANGTYRLWLPLDRGALDLVVSSPAAVPGSAEGPAPGLRRRAVSTAQLMTLPALMVPPAGRSTPILIAVSGASSGGDHDVIDGAQVVARMDQEIAPDVYLTHRALAPTNERGVVALALWAPVVGPANRYVVDVLPSAGSEQAARFGVELEVDTSTPATVTLDLDRRTTLRGVVLDETSAPLAGATVTARLSAETRCDLTAGERAVARALPLPTATTGPDGRFVLWVDDALGSRELRYDLVVEPKAGTAPSGTFAELPPGDELAPLTLPPSAYVRGQVLRADGSPAARTLVQVYEQVDRAVTCGNAGGAVVATPTLRAVGTADDDGWVGLVLPRTSELLGR